MFTSQSQIELERFAELDPRNLFAQIDVLHGNSDGLIERGEVTSWFQKQQEDIQVERSKGSKQELGNQEELIAMVLKDDKDGDGFVSWIEFSGPKGTTGKDGVGKAHSVKKLPLKYTKGDDDNDDKDDDNDEISAQKKELRRRLRIQR